MAPPTPEFQIKFLTFIQRLLDEGEFTATYKFALLMALADLSVELGDDQGAPLEIRSEDIAKKFILYYSRQARPFVAADDNSWGGVSVLHQNTGKQAAIINWVADSMADYTWNDSFSSKHLLQNSKLVKMVARNVREMPLWKLQTLKRADEDFLYPNVRKGNTITLRPGIASCFRIFHGFVYRLAQDAWIRFIRERKQNRPLLGEKTDLGAFLFGTGRVDLKVFRPLLREIQGSCCFYCGKHINTSEVDHFIPWSRYSVDLGHNFVLACRPCNNSKRDFLATPRHLDHWLSRNDNHGKTMAEFFESRVIPHDVRGSIRVAEWAYNTGARAGYSLWDEKGRFLPFPKGFVFPSVAP